MLSDAERKQRLEAFQAGPYTLVIERDGRVLFTSTKGRLAPLLEALERLGGDLRGALVLDRVIGRAAAWLCVAAGVAEVLTPLASEAGIEVLDRYGIAWYAAETVPRILNDRGDGLCPMESLALQSTSAEDFLRRLRTRTSV